MKTTRRNHASIAVVSMSAIVFFALSSAVAAPTDSSNPEAIDSQGWGDQSQSAMDEEDEAAQQQTSQASTVPDRCDDVGETSVTEQSAMIVPYELVSFDYFGMFVRYFGDVGC